MPGPMGGELAALLGGAKRMPGQAMDGMQNAMQQPELAALLALLTGQQQSPLNPTAQAMQMMGRPGVPGGSVGAPSMVPGAASGAPGAQPSLLARMLGGMR